MDLLAIWLGKATIVALRVIGRRGTALPGLVVEKVFPGFLSRRLQALAEGVVVVSGTNGKTTTTKMVATILSQRYQVLTNDTGGNFVRGTITAVLQHSSWRGRTPADVAVFELDEAHAVHFCAVHAPRRSLLLNVLRDQLDRFGEIDTTARLLSRVADATTGHVVLNRDDPRLAAFGSDAADPTTRLSADLTYFGVVPKLRALFPTDEEMYGGPVSLATQPAAAELVDFQMGGGEADLAGRDPNVGMLVTLRIGIRTHRVELQADGAHNAQNAAAAAALALTFGLDSDAVADGLRAVEPAFGRGQSFAVDGRRVVLQLVKNPAGFRQSLGTLDGLRPTATVIAINDDYADGRDMSWLWDVDFTPLAPASHPAPWLATAGTRATDMAVRLKYEEIEAALVQPDLVEAVRQATTRAQPGETVAIFATYTAMWSLHQLLLKEAR